MQTRENKVLLEERIKAFHTPCMHQLSAHEKHKRYDLKLHSC